MPSMHISCFIDSEELLACMLKTPRSVQTSLKRRLDSHTNQATSCLSLIEPLTLLSWRDEGDSTGRPNPFHGWSLSSGTEDEPWYEKVAGPE